MKKRIYGKIGGIDFVAETPGQDKVVYVAGADTYLGIHLCKHFHEHGFKVIGSGKNDISALIPFCEYKRTDYSAWDIPSHRYAWMIFAHDPHAGYDEHISALRGFCEKLKTMSGEYSLVYASSIAICSREHGAIRETDPFMPHNHLEMAYVSGENWLHTYSYESDGNIDPHIFRFCDLYGSEYPEIQTTGLVGRLLKSANMEKRLSVPGLGMRYRSIRHISDACESMISALDSISPPKCLNIPGERYLLVDLVSVLAKKFQIDVYSSRNNDIGEDYSLYAGDRNASGTFFSSIVDFKPQYKFKAWLSSI